jgi:hemin uptake protein HemP
VNNRPQKSSGGASVSIRTTEPPVIDVRDPLAGAREAIIVHAGEKYRLRVTAKDKLILTK